jgi:hypothetical protein
MALAFDVSLGVANFRFPARQFKSPNSIHHDFVRGHHGNASRHAMG